MKREQKQQEIYNMARVQKVYRHPAYQECLEKNRKAEEERVFCRHGLGHFLDVARLAYVFSLERGYGIPKEEIYVAALLHDIGKWQQYAEQIPHEQASAQIADEILSEAGFMPEERERIRFAILHHRREAKLQDKTCEDAAKRKKVQFAEILYDADKASRNCFACPAEEQCDWSREKKNLEILW